MLKRTLILFVALVSTIAIQAQDVDVILKKSIENTGGVAKWKALKTTKMEGTASMQGLEIAGVMYGKAPSSTRQEFSLQGKSMVQAYDGTTAWTINPFAGGDEPQKMGEDEAKEMTSQKFESEFIDYKTKGNTVALEGKDTIDGAETFKIKLTKKDGDIEYHYFDTENYVPIMVKTFVKAGPAKGQASETYLSDYQEVSGLFFPFFIETKMGGQSVMKITLKSVKVNEPLEDKLFAYPKK